MMNPRGLIGVVHLRPMPSDPRGRGATFDAVLEAAQRDVDALLQGGISRMIVENFGSTPFRRGTADDPVEPHTHAFMARVACAAIAAGAEVGINCLRNDGVGAIGVAAACGASFVRINVLSGAYVTDQGVIESDAANVLRYRRALDADDVAILADVLVKHAAPLGELSLADAIADTVERGGADAIVVTGRGTGHAASLEQLEQARALTDRPIVVGSGVTAESVGAMRRFVDAAIVGTSIKRDGVVTAPVDPLRVRALVDAWRTP